MIRPQNSLPYVSETVVQAGLDHALTAFKLKLDRDLLILLYDKTRARRAHLKCSFSAARAWALDSVLPQRNAQETFKYKAYSGAIGKMGSVQRILINHAPKAPQKRTALDKLKDNVMLGPDGRQFRFIL